MSGKANIKITADSKDAESGIKKVTSELNSFAKKAKSNSVANLATSFTAVTRAVKLATDAVKKVSAAVKENIELAQKQQKAEVQLAAAAKNNPYLTDASVVQLKQYASELQSISTIGDEQLLPMMSELAAAGRTQTEIQDIMKAALDLSASGMMSMESAVSALNGTLQGNVGTLGKQISGIKELSAEELKSGKAIELIKKQFDGMSESVSKQTGGWQRYKNSLGDFKEVLGSGWADLQNSVGNTLSQFFDSITSKMKVAKTQAEEFKASLNLIATNNSDTATTNSIQSEIELLTSQNQKLEKYRQVLGASKKEFVAGEKEKQAELQKTYNELVKAQEEYVSNNQDYNGDIEDVSASIDLLNEEFLKMHPELLAVEKELEAQKKVVKNAEKEYKTLKDECDLLGYTYDSLEKRIANNNERLEELKPKLDATTKAEEAQTAADEADAKAKKTQKEAEEQLIEKIKTRNELREQYNKALAQTQAQIDARKKLGESITEEEEAQLLLNTATQAYINMYSNPVFDRSQTKTGIWAGEQEQLDQIAEYAEKAKVVTDKTKEHAEDLIEAWQTQKTETLEMQKSALQDYLKYLEEKERLTENDVEKQQELIDKKQEVADAIKNIDEEMARNQAKTFATITESITSYVDKFAEITNGITDLMRQNNEAETDEAMADLSEQYTNGIISYEEYCEKKKALDKKTAQEEYKLKMWEWTASFLQATANVAQGVAKALAEGGPYAGPVLAALIGASGAVQIATIVANKPKSPSFASGGIVPGTSYSGDRVHANVNSGEMILNAQQQANLWRAANANGNGGGAVVNMPVTIQNNTDSSVKSELSPDGLLIMIDKHVNARMAEGNYTQSMNIAQNREQGKTYL